MQSPYAAEMNQEDDEMEEAEDDGDEDQAADGEQPVLPASPPPRAPARTPTPKERDPAGRGPKPLSAQAYSFAV